MRFHRRHSNPFAGTWNMLEDFNRLSRQMDRLFGYGGFEGRRPAAGVFPLFNITETGEHYTIRAELPGIKSEDLELEATAKSVVISGKREAKAEEGARYHRKERKAGKFSRVLALPAEIDPERVEAKMKNGVLTVKVSKADAVKPRRIAIG